ncbi:response regulator transcription factor [Streptomyces sp. B1866]|uniref:response regulator transcription factor n=1 Tax=Streptomyces sp. B1866 TaxID=3075431 RepID=UPI002891B4CC|nr:response regulator transcription factor [Streptomyces sp. B1866]MDT3397073.1 response regulator transcription factor [Streptomyces sp. B1866]
MKTRVLVVDPDKEAAAALAERLERNGYEVSRAATGQAALAAWVHADLVLLDLRLPDVDALEVCARIRGRGTTPVITLAAGDTELDRVLSLRSGADDCLIKPYGYRELVARMRAVMRRLAVPSGTSALSHGALRIDPRGRQVRVGDSVINVTRKEFDILYLLASLPQTVLSRRDLMAKVWADEWSVSSRTVDTHISSLRGKLGAGDWIVTVRGVGYRLGPGSTAARSEDGGD